LSERFLIFRELLLPKDLAGVARRKVSEAKEAANQNRVEEHHRGIVISSGMKIAYKKIVV
jgi:hypothetical protein